MKQRLIPILCAIVIIAVAPVTARAADQELLQQLRQSIAELKEKIAVLREHNAGLDDEKQRAPLRRGARGTQVRELQRSLNSAPGIAVARGTNPGAPGYETGYFGPATEAAVRAFQRRRTELAETGVATAETRRVLKQAVRADEEGDDVPANSSRQANRSDTEQERESEEMNDTLRDVRDRLTESEDATLRLGQPDRYEVRRGESVTVRGTGFRDGMEVLFGERVVRTVEVESAGAAEVAIPRDMPYGYHELDLRHDGVTTDSSAFLVVTEPGVEGPGVSSVTVQRGGYAPRITINGSGFTRLNRVRTPYKIYDRVASDDGERIELTIKPISRTEYEAYRANATSSIEWPMRIYIINDNGVSDPPASFTYSLSPAYE